MLSPKLPLLVCLAFLTTTDQAAPPTPDFTNLSGYIRALNRSKDPQAIAIRREIADGPAALARERAACEAEGIPLDLKSLQPSVPPDQNAAPLYEKWDTLRRRHILRPNYADMLRFGYAYTPEQLARVQKIFDENRAAMDALHQAAAKPALAFPDATLEQSFPRFATMREAARELKSESYLLARQGRYAEAIADQADALRLARQVASRGILLHYLVGAAIESITLNGLRDILYLSGPNAEVSAQVQQAIQTARPVLSLKTALIGETAYSVSFTNKYRKFTPADLASLWQEMTNQGTEYPPVKIKTFTPQQRRFVNCLLDASEAEYLSQMRRLVDAAREPGARRRALFAAVATEPGQPLNPVRSLSQGDLSIFNMVDEHDDRDRAQEEITLAAAAILAAKARTGTFPDALPDDFPDPFTDKPLGYRREGEGGFVVYSVGPNGKFDGGRPGQYEFHPPQVSFRYPAPPLQPVPPDRLK